jgi:hypothetical protein
MGERGERRRMGEREMFSTHEISSEILCSLSLHMGSLYIGGGRG